jgi:hypothetical protein
VIVFTTYFQIHIQQVLTNVHCSICLLLPPMVYPTYTYLWWSICNHIISSWHNTSNISSLFDPRHSAAWHYTSSTALLAITVSRTPLGTMIIILQSLHFLGYVSLYDIFWICTMGGGLPMTIVVWP